MNTNQMNRSVKKATGKLAHGKRRFATGLMFGSVVGSAIIFYAPSLLDKAVASGKVADAEAVLKRTGTRAHRIGDTARYTLRSMSGRMMKGAESIKRDIGKGAQDIRKTMHS